MLLPAIRFTYQFATREYGLLPMAFGNMTYWSGVWATVILLTALAVTPALRILRWPVLVDVRRMIGVTALVYTFAHMVFYFALRSWNFTTIANETLTRLTLIVATLSTIGLIALGATSLDAAIRYLGTRNWQRLHATNYAISALAILHVALARGTYPEQYLLSGIFVWLMVWRVLARHGLGADARALALLAVTSCLFTALLEAGFLWARRGYDVPGTLVNNFNPAMLEVGIPAAWQVLALGLLFALAAAGRQAVRVRPAMLVMPDRMAPSDAAADTSQYGNFLALSGRPGGPQTPGYLASHPPTALTDGHSIPADVKWDGTPIGNQILAP